MVSKRVLYDLAMLLFHPFVDCVSSRQYQVGAVVIFHLHCSNCNHRWSWQTMGGSHDETKTVNALLTGSILYTGSQPAKVKQ